ncbi:MAG TPA: ribosome maturation factor RimP [Rhodospirillaceae bacterium]|nr:ribosome maturation factor RimP [Rhodospirillaceae bacterium]
MTLEQRIAEIIGPAIEDLGFELVRVLLSGQRRKKLQIMAEPLDGSAMNVDHCADISRAVSALLDVEDPIDDAYVLEVSSPGIDRPLVKLVDFDRFKGFDARVEMHTGIDGRRRFSGRLLGIADDHVLMDVEEGEVRLPYADIQKSKLLMTDELIQAHMKAEAEAEG